MSFEEKSQDILIVDDNPMNLGVLSGILRERGYQVRVATSGQRALEAARRAKPDLIMLDISMPVMDGYEVCKALKADPDLERIPVIFISAHDEVMDKVQAFLVGGVDYVQKPFHAEEVLARAENHLKIAALSNELLGSNLELQAAKASLEELDRVKAGFTAMLVHDLRNPLGAVRMSLDVMAEEEGASQFLPKAVDEVTKCLSFLNELLEVYSGEAKGLELQVTTLDPKEMLASCLGTFQLLAAGKGVGLQGSLPEDLPDIQGDGARLDRVFANLLGNALKFTPEGGHITLSADLQEGDGVDLGRRWLRVRVQDTGRGIPAKDLPFVFDPYRQTLAKDATQGAGLGLAIVSNIVAAHQGRITVQSQEGIGTCFTVLLPCGA